VLVIDSEGPSAGPPRFPTVLSVWMVLAVMALLSVGSLAMRPAANYATRRTFALLALILVAGGIVAACHGNSADSTATPIATTVMNVTANAYDSSGNSLRASRGLQITLDVVRQASGFPLPGALQH
jgi:hypothetical protein